jgi:hypothetical protein
MESADLYTELKITLTINGRIDARTFNDPELLEDWIYCNVTEHNSEWKNIETIKQELTDIED